MAALRAEPTVSLTRERRCGRRRGDGRGTAVAAKIGFLFSLDQLVE